MKSLHKKIISIMIILASLGFTGCEDDKLVMVTTESSTEVATTTEQLATQEDATTEEVVNKVPATDEEAKITLQQIYDANKGDILLAGGKNYSLNTIYYLNDEEVYSEYQFLGFDSSGNYLQVYEDSEGFVQLLDKYNGYWYMVENNELSCLIYPEPGTADTIINYNHNDLLMSPPTESGEEIKEIYRADDELTVETTYKSDTEEFVFKYILSDDLRILAYYTYDIQGTMISYSWVTDGAVYTIPEEITKMMNSENWRNVTVTFPNGDAVDNMFIVPAELPVKVRMVEYSAYSDAEFTTQWTISQVMETGLYGDETIYMKK